MHIDFILVLVKAHAQHLGTRNSFTRLVKQTNKQTEKNHIMYIEQVTVLVILADWALVRKEIINNDSKIHRRMHRALLPDCQTVKIFKIMSDTLSYMVT